MDGLDKLMQQAMASRTSSSSGATCKPGTLTKEQQEQQQQQQQQPGSPGPPRSPKKGLGALQVENHLQYTVKLLAGCRPDELAKLEAATGMQKKMLTFR